MVFTLFGSKGWSQALCVEVKGISQGSNEFIYRSRSDRIFISSLDGLNIYDGVHTKVYRPSTHTMYGNNMQSPFFEDSQGRIWFSTYQALNYYDPAKDDLEYFFMVSIAGDTIYDNYKVFHLDEHYVYLKAGKEVFVFDIQAKTIRQKIQLNLSAVSFMLAHPMGNDILVVAAAPDTMSLYTLDSQFGFKLEVRIPLAASELLSSSGKIWIGTQGGKILALHTDSFVQDHVYSTPNGKCSGIAQLNDSILVISNFTDTLFYFNERTNVVDWKVGMISAEGRNAPLFGITEVYIDRDSLVWIAPLGLGLHVHNLKGRKFAHILEGNDITSILKYREDNYIAQTRRNGIFLCSSRGAIEGHWNKLPGGTHGFNSHNGILIDGETLLFTVMDTFYTLHVVTGRINKIKFKDTARVKPYRCQRLSNGRIIVANEGNVLYDLTVSKGLGRYTPYVDLSGKTNLILNFQEDKSANLYVSNDDINILVLKPEPITKSHVYSHSLAIASGIKYLYDDTAHQVLYLANSDGLTRIDKKTNVIHLIVDKQFLLTQTIYSIQADKRGKLWLGTNSGLVCYDPATNTSHSFSRLDGIQWNEFNSHVCHQEDDGSMWFGGVNGLNYFNPENIPIDPRPARTMITHVLINDRPDSSHLTPSWDEHYVLPYDQNTIAFQFHAIDFAQPQSTRVKYRLEGMDEDYIESSQAHATIRYPKLPPGAYVLSIYGQNGDGVWNATPDEISIVVSQPYWRTWWFMMLAVISLLALVYLAVRLYFKQKLRKQAIIIEKQQAVEQERTRIAAEMHDDLGAGLTTIRYLSDKALKQAENREEIAQIQRIADQSNALVRNMSEIIWAMNSRFDTAESLVSYLRRYAVEYLSEKNIPVAFNATEQRSPHTITGEKRRNIFLVVKELLNNTVKYAGASAVHIDVGMDGSFQLTIREVGGIGFDPQGDLEKGNGLYNCERRMKSIGGTITFVRQPKSMDITLTVPLTS